MAMCPDVTGNAFCFCNFRDLTILSCVSKRWNAQSFDVTVQIILDKTKAIECIHAKSVSIIEEFKKNHDKLTPGALLRRLQPVFDDMKKLFYPMLYKCIRTLVKKEDGTASLADPLTLIEDNIVFLKALSKKYDPTEPCCFKDYLPLMPAVLSSVTIGTVYDELGKPHTNVDELKVKKAFICVLKKEFKKQDFSTNFMQMLKAFPMLIFIETVIDTQLERYLSDDRKKVDVKHLMHTPEEFCGFLQASENTLP